MKSKYLIISKSGDIQEPLKYKDSSECSRDMKICIEREALGVNPSISEPGHQYIKYANKLGFNWEKNSPVGFIQYDYKANLISRLVQEYARLLVNSIGFPIYEVRGSNMFDMKFPVVDAYAKLFGDRLFKIKSDKNKYVISYDASYPHFNLASEHQLKEENLPFGHFSISDCYRNEQRGECMLLFRGRRFFMPDLHPYFKNLDEAWAGYFQIEKQLVKSFNDINRNFVNVVKVSSQSNWDKYQSNIVNIAKSGKREMLIEIKMDDENRYWIVDIDYSIIDKLSQIREIGCIQIDIGNAERLGIKYVNKNGIKNYPIIIHAAVPGGIERYIYMVFDQFKENFPLWLHPIHIRLIPVSEKYIDLCCDLVQINSSSPVRFDIDDRAESVSKRIKIAHEDLIPFHVVIGEKEAQNLKCIELQSAIDKVKIDSVEKPFLPMNWPLMVSKQLK